MKPKTKLQKQVVELSKHLPPLTEAQKHTRMSTYLRRPVIIGRKAKSGVSVCGCVDEVLKPLLAVSRCGNAYLSAVWRKPGVRALEPIK
ncbi:hypothetical protein [Bacteroides cellulosilyticus]|uniref:hypothetical protein n=1 Tax=Bacteroides cellulosilyticus TaxID=246787 RepID=UPI0007618A45|nr:hypothetical protein [Bacteroides cellulosilyticus]